MVDFELLLSAAVLAPPSVPLENLQPELLVGLGIKPKPRLLWAGRTHWLQPPPETDTGDPAVGT
jgi:hypothetical protein